MNNFSAMWDFPVMENVNYENANRIHPLMQKRIGLLLQAMEKDPDILKIVLFGSSLDFRCNSQSDIDLYTRPGFPAVSGN